MGFEKDIIVFLQKFSSPLLDGIFKVISYMFDYPLVIVVALLLLLFKKYKQMVYFLILEGVGLVSQLTLKALINRPRPYVTHNEIRNILEASNSSFPSGHSVTCMMAVVFLFCLIKDSNLKRNTKIVCYSLLGGALFMCLINRMYLGQHYLTDVLGGFVISLVLGSLIMKFLYYKKPNKNKVG